MENFCKDMLVGLSQTTQMNSVGISSGVIWVAKGGHDWDSLQREAMGYAKELEYEWEFRRNAQAKALEMMKEGEFATVISNAARVAPFFAPTHFLFTFYGENWDGMNLCLRKKFLVGFNAWKEENMEAFEWATKLAKYDEQCRSEHPMNRWTQRVERDGEEAAGEVGKQPQLYDAAKFTPAVLTRFANSFAINAFERAEEAYVKSNEGTMLSFVKNGLQTRDAFYYADPRFVRSIIWRLPEEACWALLERSMPGITALAESVYNRKNLAHLVYQKYAHPDVKFNRLYYESLPFKRFARKAPMSQATSYSSASAVVNGLKEVMTVEEFEALEVPCSEGEGNFTKNTLRVKRANPLHVKGNKSTGPQGWERSLQRFVHALWIGEMNASNTVKLTCENSRCVNTAHFEEAKKSVSMKRKRTRSMEAKKAKAKKAADLTEGEKAAKFAKMSAENPWLADYIKSQQ